MHCSVDTEWHACSKAKQARDRRDDLSFPSPIRIRTNETKWMRYARSAPRIFTFILCTTTIREHVTHRVWWMDGWMHDEFDADRSHVAIMDDSNHSIFRYICFIILSSSIKSIAHLLDAHDVNTYIHTTHYKSGLSSIHTTLVAFLCFSRCSCDTNERISRITNKTSTNSYVNISCNNRTKSSY